MALKRLFVLALCFVFLSACDDSASSDSPKLTGINLPAGKADGFVQKSAADLRREIAAVTASDKKFEKQRAVPNTLYYTCDRETLPRTCCYYILNGGGGVYGGSPSCTEENH